MKKGFKIFIIVVAVSVLGVVTYDFSKAYMIDGSENEYEFVLGKYYYDFDEVLYYKTAKDFDDLVAIDKKEIKTLKDSITSKLMTDFDEAVSYDVAAVYLDSIGFEKKVLPPSKHAALREIFREKISNISETTVCEPIYRDIYVFKKNGKLAGIAKLCYSCGQSRFIGTNANTENFGMDGEFGTLEKIVK